MIDIDDDIDESWMNPKEGFKESEEDEDEDNVTFGKYSVDRLIGSLGTEKMIPLLEILVMKTLENDNDWRFKNCGLMALSQVGEYIEEPKNIAPIVPKVIEHFGHKNPKVRYAAIHCIGQLAEDMD
jgi:hypothetical protein